jgi:N-dimethylarginine dimethylaminohydrolase
MLDRRTALACVEVLGEEFIHSIAQHGIDVIPTTYQEARDLAGNVVSLDGRTILTSTSHPRVSSALRKYGFDTIELSISQFSACGGGLHCLTMPLARRTEQ